LVEGIKKSPIDLDWPMGLEREGICDYEKPASLLESGVNLDFTGVTCTQD
jgi:hypothetical protein